MGLCSESSDQNSFLIVIRKNPIRPIVLPALIPGKEMGSTVCRKTKMYRVGCASPICSMSRESVVDFKSRRYSPWADSIKMHTEMGIIGWRNLGSRRQIIDNLNGAFYRCHTVRPKVLNKRRVKTISHDGHVPAISTAKEHRAADVARLTQVIGLLHPRLKRPKQ